MRHTLTLAALLLPACGDKDGADDTAAIDVEPTVDAAERCAAITASVADAGFADRVTVRCDDTLASVVSDTWPDHTMMDGITSTIEQIPVPAVDWAAPIPLQPRWADAPTTVDAAVAVAVNGVPIYDYSAGGDLDIHTYDPDFDAGLLGQLDICNGHAGRGDDYHYHGHPDCMVAAMDNAGDDAILGWAFDGYPIYGYANPDGTPIADGVLDVCNGRPDATFGWRYHATTAPPYFIQCLDGAVDTSIFPRVAPLESPTTGEDRPYGQTVDSAEAVADLTYVQTGGGGGELSWLVDGERYGIRTTPSGTADCYDYEIDTRSGEVLTGEYCRRER